MLEFYFDEPSRLTWTMEGPFKGHIASFSGDVGFANRDIVLFFRHLSHIGVHQLTLHEDHRIVVGKGNRAATQFGRGIGNLLRAGIVGQGIDLARLADIPVLAELAGQVAAGGAETEYRGARQEMIKRFFLDRVYAEPAGTPVAGQHDLAILVAANETQAALALTQFTETRA